MKGCFINERLYVIPTDDGENIVFDVNSSSIVLSQLSSDEIKNSASEYYGDEIDCKMVEDVSKDIQHVIVGVAETCNLRCTYCYAEQGTYGKIDKKIMSFSDLKTMLERILEIAPKGIKSMCFFGDEPLLGFSAIKEFVIYATQYLPKINLAVPSWGIVTNGTLITDEINSFFNEHHFSVNVSLDGPKSTNDIARIFPDKSKSVFDTVKNNLSKLTDRRYILSCQSTLSRDFFMQYQPGGYAEFIEEMYGLGYDYVAPLIAQCEETNNLDSTFSDKIEAFYRDMVDYDFDKLLSGKNIEYVSASTLTIISRLVNCTYCASCKAGATSLYYSTSGDFYPCHLNYEMKDSPLNLEELKRVKIIKAKDKLSCKDCSTCFARNICFSWCPGIDKLLENGHDAGSCLGQKVSLEFILNKIVHVYNDESLVEKFTVNYQTAVERPSNAVKISGE